MSIVALKRKTKHITSPISGRGKNGFSLNGGYRNQGRVGQTLFGRSLGGTKFIGTTPVGNGGCCGKYSSIISNSGGCCTNDPKIPKRSSMNTKGRIQSGLIHPVGGEYRNIACNKTCRKIWVKNTSSLNQAQSDYINKVSAEAARKVVRKSDAGIMSCNSNGNGNGSCKAASYFIGTVKHVRTPYAKNLNAFPISQGQYMKSILFNKRNLPTPPCKQHFPPTINTKACGVYAKTPEEAIALGLLPKDWGNCNPENCIHSGLPHKQPAVSQNIPINTPISSYTAEQKKILKGQRIETCA